MSFSKLFPLNILSNGFMFLFLREFLFPVMFSYQEPSKNEQTDIRVSMSQPKPLVCLFDLFLYIVISQRAHLTKRLF